MNEPFDIKTAKVKDCPCRKHCHESVRNYGADEWFACQWPEGHTAITCRLHGNSKLSSCNEYAIWSEKQVRDAFKKLDEAEAHRDAVLAVLRM